MTRSLEPEVMDSPDIPAALLEQFHKDLHRIHGLLGTYRTIERFLRADPLPVRRVLDIGCGGGDLLLYLRRRMGVGVIGIDPKPAIVPGLEIATGNAITADLPKADVAVCTMLGHHLTPEENIALIRNVARSSRRFLILDLIRHPLPLTLFTAFLCPLIGREAGADGRQSIRRSFTPTEYLDLAQTAIAGIPGATVQIDVAPLRSRQVLDLRFPA